MIVAFFEASCSLAIPPAERDRLCSPDSIPRRWIAVKGHRKNDVPDRVHVRKEVRTEAGVVAEISD